MSGSELRTIPALFAHRLDQDPSRPALHVHRGDAWPRLTWAEIAGDVRRTAVVFHSLGVAPGDRVLLASKNRYEWITTDLGIQCARATHVPAHASLSGSQIAYQIRDSGARVVVLADDEQADKLAAVPDELPEGVVYVSFDPCSALLGGARPRLLSELMAEQRDDAAEHIFRDAVQRVGPDDLSTILYTSGTTGEPKGVMLSQNNLATNAAGALAMMTQSPDDLRLTWLPLSHIFARTCDLYGWIGAGAELALADGPDTILANCHALRPSLINGVPYFFEKVMRALIDGGKADLPGALAGAFGGRMRLCCSGGAALPDHVARFYQERDVTLVQGYGLTESSPVISTGTPAAYRLGTVGRAIPGVEVATSSEGEILTRGPHVMVGYWKMPQATAETIVDGWLHTGDLGEIDAEGFIRITGRKKELIVTAAGKNIAPVYLEALLTADPLIQQALVIGDARNYLTALIVPNFDALRSELVAAETGATDPAALVAQSDVQRLYADHIKQRLSGVSHYEQVQKFTLVAQPFTTENGQLTLTLKLRRRVIQERYAELIESLYRK